MTFRRIIIAIGAAIVLVTPGVKAEATTLVFTLSGGDNVTWFLDSNAIPVLAANNPTYLDVQYNHVTVNGLPNGSFDLFTASPPLENGFTIVDNPFVGVSAVGPQIYSGPITSPAFILDTPFLLARGGNAGGQDTLIISATPLPAALPLFATGLGVMGLLARRRKRKPAADADATDSRSRYLTHRAAMRNPGWRLMAS
jgi:hypothetical protein